jgi:bla regulator protein blaR1
MIRPAAFRASCVALLIAACGILPGIELRGQAAPTTDAAQSATAQLPTYDVVSIKAHKDEGMMMRSGMRVTPDGFQTDGFPLQMFLLQSFGLSADRILNEPDWVKSARYDIQAKVAPDDAPKLKELSVQQRFAMMLPVLEERFGLKFHHETKVLQVYSLVVAKGGPKLKESTIESGADVPPPPLPSAGAIGAQGGGGAKGAPEGPRTMMRMSTQGMTMDAHGSTMASLSQLISQQVSATVVDKTGLAGKYDFTLSFTPDNFMMNGQMMRQGGGAGSDGGAETQEPVGPSIFTAVQEQLGLKLVAEKQPVDVVVIDHIEQPTAN